MIRLPLPAARRAAAAFCLAAALSTAVQAQDPQAEEAFPWLKWDFATGDWYGNRPLLSQRGFDFLATYTSQTWGNVAGGAEQGIGYIGLLQFGTDVDLEKAFGWKGASFRTTWVYLEGGLPSSDFVGTVFPISGIEGPTGLRALALWLQQKFYGDLFTLRAGMFNIDSEFTISDRAALFLNAAFGWPLIYSGTMGGPPSFPFAAPGIYAAIEPGGGWKFQFTAMQGDVYPPYENAANFYWRIDRMNGILFAAEAQYPWDKAPLPGVAKLGAMFSTGYPDLTDGEGQEAWGATFFYGIVDQMLWREPGTSEDPLQGLGWFARGGFASTPDRSTLAALINTGLTYTGTFPGREADALGAGFVLTDLSDGAANQLAGSNRGYEAVCELTYQAQITPYLSVQPDIQYVLQPGGSTAQGNALVIGMSVSIDF